ncbi:MAG: 3-oxoadipate enol-lactonase [Acidobacteriota bacterium]|nr:3-oxoadipate enol-lactonase [Acidobacteriota bacterium]
MPFVETKDLRMHYQVDGPEHAPTLVLSNSLGTTLELWDPQITDFSRKFRVLRYDSRGHGRTTVTLGEYSVELLAKDVIALMDALNIERAHFCGLSIGGMTGMWLGANAAARLNKLVLCNTSVKIGTVESWKARIDAVRQGGMKNVAESVIERWFTADFRAREPIAVAQTRKMIEGTDASGYMASCAAVRDFNFGDHLREIGAPTLVVAGAKDPATTPADGQRLAGQIPGAKYVELNAAHISNVEEAKHFTEHVGAFLEDRG